MLDLGLAGLTLLLLLGLPILGLRGRARFAAVAQELPEPAAPVARGPVLAPPQAAPAPAGLRWTATGANQWDSGPYRVAHQGGSWYLFGRMDKVLVLVKRFDSLGAAQDRAQEIADGEPVP